MKNIKEVGAILAIVIVLALSAWGANPKDARQGMVSVSEYHN